MFPIACIAFSRENRDSLSIKYGWSVYHPNDTFDKKRARAIAEARMNKLQYSTQAAEPKVNAVLDAIFADLFKINELQTVCGSDGPDLPYLPSRMLKQLKRNIDKKRAAVV